MQTRGTDGTAGTGATRGTGAGHIIGMTRGTGATLDITAGTDITGHGIMTAGHIITRITDGTAPAATYMAEGTHISATGTALQEATAQTLQECLRRT